MTDTRPHLWSWNGMEEPATLYYCVRCEQTTSYPTRDRVCTGKPTLVTNQNGTVTSSDWDTDGASFYLALLAIVVLCFLTVGPDAAWLRFTIVLSMAAGAGIIYAVLTVWERRR